MLKNLPDDCQILATHPLFGPESGKNGIRGLKIVLWPVRVDTTLYDQVKLFLFEALGMQIIEMSPDEHDQEMAFVHGLTFFIGEALRNMKISDEKLKTATYQHLLEIQYMSQKHTKDLFETMEIWNPYARTVRSEFLKELEKIQITLKV